MPLLPSRFPAKLKPRIDFSPNNLRIFIGTNGLALRWEQAAECPCRRDVADYGGGFTGSTQDVSQPRSDCPTCQGRGYRYHSAQEIKANITSAAQHPDRFAQYGEMASGMISVTTLPEHRLNLGDRITPLQSVQRFRETHLYDDAIPVSQTRYPIKVRELDVIPAPLNVGVLDLYVTNAAGVAEVGGEKVEGVDYTITAEGKIQWINAPEVGASWSVSYYATPRYIVKDIPHPFRDTMIKTKALSPIFASLPINATCVLEFLDSGGF